jgi:hypothetical protein
MGQSLSGSVLVAEKEQVPSHPEMLQAWQLPEQAVSQQ